MSDRKHACHCSDKFCNADNTLKLIEQKLSDVYKSVANHILIKNDAIAEVNRCHAKIKMYESIMESVICALDATNSFPRSIDELRGALKDGRL